jgi:radical SAM superfamily enzyme YgiQ (UPF0313 family)
MKFLFIQKNSFPAAGPMIISALLKEHGFTVDLLLASQEKELINSIKEIGPNIIGISCFTGEHQWAVELCQQIKRNFSKIVTILGGPHPTYYPEIINEEGVDIISRGESEFAVLELMKKLQNKEDINQIKNLWIKKDNEIIKNEIDNLNDDLDVLPNPDREIYYKYHFLKKVSVKQFLSGRGCPYQCTFCANNLLHRLYQDKGKFIRRRSPLRVVEEILDVQARYGLKTVSFTDDVFINDQKWLEEFLFLYKERVNLPFMCNVTAQLATEEVIRLLKKNCCYGISLGIESGVQEIRFNILKKFITDEQIINVARLAKKYKLVLKSYNIVGLPGETINDAIKTLRLNAKIKSDFAACSLLQLFPKYEITEIAKEKNVLDEDYGTADVKGGIYQNLPLEIKNKNQFINLQKLFFLGVKFPILIPLIKQLIKLPPNFFLNLIGQGIYGFFMSRVHRLTFKDMINYALHIDPYDI